METILERGLLATQHSSVRQLRLIKHFLEAKIASNGDFLATSHIENVLTSFDSKNCGKREKFLFEHVTRLFDSF